MNWLEVSLTLDGELAEAVADVLARYAHQGVSIESTAIVSSPDDEGRPTGPVRVRAYLPAHDPAALETARQKIESDLFYLGMIRPLPDPAYTSVADTDWAELWKAHYQPVRIGKQLMIVPIWLKDTYRQIIETMPDDVPLWMDPGMAFGTGSHPTTQLCLSYLEESVRPGHSVLDLGCGSGILAVAAAKLGATRALGMDIEHESVQATLHNAAVNGVEGSIEARLGSLADLLADGTSPVFNITVANILAPVIVKLLSEGLAQTVAPGGRLIVSGILAEQADSVTAALDKAGMKTVNRKQSGDWVALQASA